MIRWHSTISREQFQLLNIVIKIHTYKKPIDINYNIKYIINNHLYIRYYIQNHIMNFVIYYISITFNV